MNNKLKTTIIVFIIWFLTYFGTKIINGIIRAPNSPIYILPIEYNIPYIPELFPIYFLAVPLAFLPLFLIKNKNLFKKTTRAYLITTIITGVIFLIYPTKIPRPQIISTGIYSETISFFYSLILPTT